MGYLGSKAASGAYQAIIAKMPPHDTYIEAYLGTGAVMKRKPLSARSIGIDLDGGCLKAYQGDPTVELVEADAVQYLAEFDYRTAGRTLVYADPPYLHMTRSSAARYRHEYTEADHMCLLACLRAIPAMVLVSGYPSRLYDEVLTGWNTCEFQVMTHGGPRTEKLWWNYSTTAKQWAKFAGANFTERQRIARKAERWASRYKELPPGERLAILAAILEKEGDEHSQK